jgi:hypothetical protein
MAAIEVVDLAKAYDAEVLCDRVAIMDAGSILRFDSPAVSTSTVVGARISVTIAIAFAQMAILIGLGAGAFGLVLSGSWWMSIPPWSR